MKDYEASAQRAGSGFHMNPSPGNIRDGLITDAMKSAGAAKKGGNAPVVTYWIIQNLLPGPVSAWFVRQEMMWKQQQDRLQQVLP